MVWWEAVLSPALQVLFDKLTSGDIKEFLRRFNIPDLLIEKLKIACFTNAVVLNDAEEKQYDDPAIETWLDMLQDAILEAEDMLDELATEAHRCKLESQVSYWNFLCTSFNPLNEGMAPKILELIDRLEYIAKQKDVLGLKCNVNGKVGIIRRKPTTPLLIDSHVYGRDVDREEIIKLVVAEDNSSYNMLSVIPILGMGGIGKTTLAQIVYNDKRIDEVFDVKAWACVSDDFSATSIIKALLESASKRPCDTSNLEILQDSLKKKLNNKKFFIVLDDVWNENYEDWKGLLVSFMAGAEGSKIIITTRNKDVLSAMNTLPPYHLKEMSAGACWSLFLLHAFGNRNSDAFLNLKEMGRAIVTKCNGLPLAVRTLGGLLGSKLDTGYWNKILRSNLWDLPPKKNAILPALKLSYLHLDTNLKKCFAYCSIFPKGHEYRRKDLILLWMAEGFIQPVEKTKTMEEVGDEYFAELLSRSLFQESEQSKDLYVMHDLVNDLAKFVSRKLCIRLEDIPETSKQFENFEKARHFSYIQSKYDTFKKFEPVDKMKWLRTFLPVASPSGFERCFLTKRLLCDLLPKLSCLRALCLSGYCISILPDSIGNLKHLRYLNLSFTEIRSLPQSINTLHNLQTLILCECGYLEEFPADMGTLINLQHLDISGSGIQEMPLQIDNLVSLHTLPEFIVGSARSGISKSEMLPVLSLEEVTDDLNARRTNLKSTEIVGSARSGISKLGKLLLLQGSLSISSLENVTDAWEAKRANLKSKENLNELVLAWSNNYNDLRNESVETDVLDMLQPYQMLEKLTIKSFGGSKFPIWVGDPSFSKLVSLSLIDCNRCTTLPQIGQLPSLKRLFIKGLPAVTTVGYEFYGSGISTFKHFPSLEVLSFEEMLEWKDWSSSGGSERFPCLCELNVKKCPKLQSALPHLLPSLEKLVIHESELLVCSFPRVTLLQELDLKGCDKALISSTLNLTLLTSLHLQNIPNLMHLPEGLIQNLPCLERLVIAECYELVYLTQNKDGLQHLTSLLQLTIRNCPELVFLFEKEQQQLPVKLEYLELDACQNLQKLPHALHELLSLQELTVKDCPRLQSFSETNLPSKLNGLAIQGCGLESLPEAMICSNASSLELLYIGQCYFLTSFSKSSELSPTTFKHLTIDNCLNLESLPDGIMHGNSMYLEVLEIFDCASITSFPRGQLPTTLKTLTIWNCCSLSSLAEVTMQTMSLESLRIGDCANLISLPTGLHKLTYLDYFEIDGCSSLVSFPPGGLPATSLKKVRIFNCESLKSLPEQLQNLTSLQELRLSGCPSLTSFPEGAFPINLLSLDIKDCSNIKPLSEWGLHSLTSLKEFSIYGGCPNLGSFPEWLLPSTLKTLNIGKLPNLESLSIWMQNLTALEELKIKECHKLCSLPEEGLPATVSCLEINDCPQLKEFCDKNWSKIDHIPCIVM